MVEGCPAIDRTTPLRQAQRACDPPLTGEDEERSIIDRHPGLDPGSSFFKSRRMERTRKGGWVYIMANRYRGTIYVGMTSDLAARIYQHRSGEGSDFCARYDLNRLVWAESAGDITLCIEQEKRMKHWRREWKFALIERANPDWIDLFERLN